MSKTRNRLSIVGFQIKSILSLISWRNILFTAQIILNTLSGYAFIKILAYKYGNSGTLAGFWIAYSIPGIFVSILGSKYIYGILGSLFTRLYLKKEQAIDDAFSFFLNLHLRSNYIKINAELITVNYGHIIS